MRAHADVKDEDLLWRQVVTLQDVVCITHTTYNALTIPAVYFDLWFFYLMTLPMFFYMYLLFGSLFLCFKGKRKFLSYSYIKYRSGMMEWIRLKKAVRKQQRG